MVAVEDAGGGGTIGTALTMQTQRKFNAQETRQAVRVSLSEKTDHRRKQ
jgi:hypothetical protein